jgi:hypothetical protein
MFRPSYSMAHAWESSKVRWYLISGRYQAPADLASLATLLAILDPSLIVTVGDNDAGGFATLPRPGLRGPRP